MYFTYKSFKSTNKYNMNFDIKEGATLRREQLYC